MTLDANEKAANVNTLWARAFVDELARSGLRSVCISPGSRSTPLVVQFAEHPDIEDISIVDERCAAFFALGLAQASRRPVALVCTSGTAAANYFPAICEAASSGVGLLVLTADRPPELHDSGASQAMDQLKLYGDHVRWFHQVAQPEATPQKLRYVRGLACRAYHQAQGSQTQDNKTQGSKSGPVHLNMPFRKPLEPIAVPDGHPDSVPATLADDDPVARNGRADNRPFLTIHTGTLAPDLGTIQAFQDALSRAKRPLILAGADRNGQIYRQQLCNFAERIGAPIAAEPTSGLRHWQERSRPVLSTADFLFESRFYDHLGAPDLVIRTGRAPLLWSSQALVRRLQGAEQIVVGPAEHAADPDHLVSWQIRCDERALFDSTQAKSVSGAWLEAHSAAEDVALEAFRRELRAQRPLSAPRLWDELGQMLPDGAGLFVSNSMPIRNLDTFMCSARSSIDVFFNRGLNGIDGINSTGLGVAVGRKAAGEDTSGREDVSGNQAPTVIVTGDVALRHDIGGLMLAAEMQVDATIIVVDNDGGAIFDYLPIAQFESVHRRHFTTPPACPVAPKRLDQQTPDQQTPDQQTPDQQTPDQNLFGHIEVREPDTWQAFRDDVEHSLSASGTQLIRVCTDAKIDKHTRESVRRRVADHIDQTICDFTS